MVFIKKDKSFEVGESVQIPVIINNANVEGFQLTMNYDNSKLIVESIEGTNNAFSKSNYRLLDNAVAMSWNNSSTEQTQNFVINAFAIESGKISEVLSISNDVVKSELYKDGGQVSTPKLDFGNDQLAQTFELYQNTPNPFRGATMVGFHLPNAAKAKLTIYV